MKVLRAWPAWFVLAHALIGLMFNIVVPPWEGYDETGHFVYVTHLADGKGLLNSQSQSQTPKSTRYDQMHQPPLYYALAALPAFFIDRTENITPQQNIFATDGTNRHGVRQFLRSTQEDWLWMGNVLALHLARLVSLLISCLNVVLIAALARHILGDGRAAQAATAIAAFNPQALFMGSLVNNDVLINATGAATALVLAHISSQKIKGVAHFATLGALLGLSFWAKRTSLSLLLATALCVALIGLYRRWGWRKFFVNALVTAGIFVAIAAPLVASNLSRYGVILPDREAINKVTVNTGALVDGGLRVALRDGWLPSMFDNAFRTFWGGFGWGNVKLPDGVFALLYALAGVGLLGLGMGVVRRRSSALVLPVLALCVFIFGIAILPAARALAYHDQSLLVGRYLLPALGPVTCLIALGWRELGRMVVDGGQLLVDGVPKIHESQWQIGMGLTALASLAVPVLLLRPLYAPSVSCAPPGPALLQFENTARITSINAEYVEQYDLALQRMLPFAKVSLGWNTFPTPEQLAVGVSVVGRNGEVLGTENKYPQGGNFPSVLWKTCNAFQDVYWVELRKNDATLPARGRVSVSLFVPGDPITRTLSTSDGAGKPSAPLIGEFRVTDYTQKIAAKAPKNVYAQIGNVNIARIMFSGLDDSGSAAPSHVLGAKAGSSIKVQMTYVATGKLPRATGFVQLLDSAGQRVAGDDHPPAGEDLPTDFWLDGDVVNATYSIALPSDAKGRYELVTGLYDSATIERLSTDEPNNLITLALIDALD